jgi:predicted 3-demethylubiquinone-9 3-methyltransferase (glyoxalase superfamily)
METSVPMQKIITYLWFDKQAKEAAEFYCTLFSNSRIVSVSPMVVVFELEGQRFMALNGGPRFKFTEAISLYVDCNTQEEVDALWNKLTADGGAESMCGWLKDKYGLSWQIIPNALIRLMNDKDPGTSKRVVEAMLKMKKIDIRALENAWKGS